MSLVVKALKLDTLAIAHSLVPRFSSFFGAWPPKQLAGNPGNEAT